MVFYKRLLISRRVFYEINKTKTLLWDSAIRKFTSRAVTEVTILDIVRLAFNEKYKWEFYYKGNKISAKIIDEGFNQKVDEGESFAKGDSLEVEMTINQEFDPSVIHTLINPIRLPR